MSITIARRCVPGLLLAASLTGCAGAAAATAPPPGPPNAVGTQPAVQLWFERTQPQQIALQNALQQAYVQLAQGTGNGCASLDAAAQAVLATLPSPKPTTSSAADPQIARHSCTATLLWLSDPVAGSNLKRALDLTATAFVSAEDAFHVARTCQNYCPLALATTPPQSPCICSINRLTRAFRTSSPPSAVDEDTPF